jgi:hypothetical protein
MTRKEEERNRKTGVERKRQFYSPENAFVQMSSASEIVTNLPVGSSISESSMFHKEEEKAPEQFPKDNEEKKEEMDSI